jgi:hypothetical protein
MNAVAARSGLLDGSGLLDDWASAASARMLRSFLPSLSNAATRSLLADPAIRIPSTHPIWMPR